MIRPDFREIKHSQELYHYGIKRRSGRYPWGSVERPYQDGVKKYGSELFRNSEKSEVNFKMNNFYYLSHGGPGSGRYPLGSGDRPYQKFEGSRRRSSGISGYISANKKEKERVKEVRKKIKKELHEADKERVLKSGTAHEVYRYRGELSKSELQDVYNRLNLERKISEMSSTELLDNQKVVKAVLNNVTKTAGWVAEGAVAYNILASVYNAMVDKSKQLPVLKINR